MKPQINTRNRPGATLVEYAVILPVFLLLWLGLIILGLGVFRYFQVANLAREGARYAIVRGTNFAEETKDTAATKDSIDSYVRSKAVGMNTDTESFIVEVSWNKFNSPAYPGASGEPVANTVTVTVYYNWIPELFFGGMWLSSTSEMPMAF